MIKQAVKFSSSIMKDDPSQLTELRREKEKILREMKEQEEKRKMRKLQTCAKNKPVIKDKFDSKVIAKDNFDSKPMIQEKVKKIPKLPVKSFNEVMREANEKETMRKRQAISNAEVPMKKQKLSSNNMEDNLIGPPLRSINSLKRNSNVLKNSRLPEPDKINKQSSKIAPVSHTSSINSSREFDKRHHFTKSADKHNHKQSEMPNPKYVNEAKLESNRTNNNNRGILAQSGSLKNINTDSSNRKNEQPSKPTRQLECSSNKEREFQYNNKPTKEVNRKGYGILAQNNIVTKSNNRNSDSVLKVRQNDSVRSDRPEIKMKTKNVVQSENIRGTQAKSKNDSRGIQAQQNNRSVQSKNSDTRFIQAKNSEARGIQAQSARGIQAQSGRGIQAQSGRGIQAQSSRGIQSQNGGGIYAQSARGIQAQSARGIQAQNSRGIPAKMSQRDLDYSSRSEDEYDSELDDFIEGSEYSIDEDTKKVIHDSLRYDPSKYAKVSRYDDCRNMESSSKQIRIEEEKSVRIAREEDRREAKLEEERLKRKGKL